MGTNYSTDILIDFSFISACLAMNDLCAWLCKMSYLEVVTAKQGPKTASLSTQISVQIPTDLKIGFNTSPNKKAY